jgi:hypothetical protein
VTGCDELGETKCSQTWRAPLIHAKVEARAARRESDTRRRTDVRLGSFPQARGYASQPPSPQVIVRNTSPVILYPLQSLDKLLRHPRNFITVEHFLSPILFATEVHFPSVLLHNQSYPKVCPDPLNLPNAGDSFTGISSLPSCSLFSPTRDLIVLI